MSRRTILFTLTAGVALATLVGFSGVSAKAKKHRIVFEVNVANEEQWQAVLNNVENVQKAFGRENTQIEVVTHGKGLGLLRTTNAAMAERLQNISASGVVFAACENTMRRMDMRKEDLLPFAMTVDAGVAEIVRKQEAGWSYIKGGT